MLVSDLQMGIVLFLYFEMNELFLKYFLVYKLLKQFSKLEIPSYLLNEILKNIYFLIFKHLCLL